MIINDEAVEYTLKAEKDNPDKTIFLIKEMDSSVSFMLLEQATSFDENGKIKSQDLAKSTKIMIEQGLVGWKNFKNKKGEIPYARENIYKLPLSTIYELVTAIETLSHPTKAEIKN